MLVSIWPNGLRPAGLDATNVGELLPLVYEGANLNVIT